MACQSVFHSKDSDHPSPLEQSFDREDTDCQENASMNLETPSQESGRPSDPPPVPELFVPLKMYFQDIHRRPSPREMVYMLYAIHQIFSGEQSFDEEDRVREIASGLWIDEGDLAEALQKRELTSNLMEKFLERLCRQEGDHFLSLASSDLIEKTMEENSPSSRGSVFTKVDWDEIPADIERVEGMNYYQGVLFTPFYNTKYRGYFVGCTPSKRYSILFGSSDEYEEIFSEKIDLVPHTFLTRLLDVPRSGDLCSLGCDTVQYRSHYHRPVDFTNCLIGYMFPNQVLYNYPKELFGHIILHSCDSSIRIWIHRVFYRSSSSSGKIQWGSGHSTYPTPYPYTPDENLLEQGCHSLETWKAEMEHRRRVLTPLAAEIHEKIAYALNLLRTEKSHRYQTTWDGSFEPRQEWFGIRPEIDAFLITPPFVTTILQVYTRQPSLSGMHKFLTIYRLANQEGESYLNRVYIEAFLKVTLECGSIEEYQAYLDAYRGMVREGRHPRFGLDLRQVYDTLHKRSITRPLREEFLPFHRLVVESLEELGNNEELIQRLEELV